MQEFISYVRDFMEEDKMHSERFQTKEREFEIPEDAEIL